MVSLLCWPCVKEAGLRVKIRLYERNAKVGLRSFRIREERGGGSGEKALENQGSGDLIDDVFAVKAGGSAGRARGMAGGVEEGVGVMGG
jgi:hypothetical protein